MTTLYSPLDAAIEDLVYLHEAPPDRVAQTRRVEGILRDVVLERVRQERIGIEKRAAGVEWRSCADPAMAGGDPMRYLVLAEEVGEVARALLELDPARFEHWHHLRAELVEVAAVAVATIESIDQRGGR